MNYLDIFSKAIKISWKHKQLWWFGVIASLPFALLMLPLLFWNMYWTPRFFSLGGLSDANLLFPSDSWMTLYLVFLVLTALVSFISCFLLVIGLIGCTLGVMRIDRDESISFRYLFRESLPFFWRVLGLMLLIWVALMTCVMILEGILMFVSVITFGLGMILAMPLMLLLYPLTMVVYGFSELCLMAIIMEDMKVLAALRRGWELFSRNFWQVALLCILLYLATWLASLIIIVPLVIVLSLLSSLSFIPTTLLTADTSGLTVIMVIAGIVVAACIPLCLIFAGWSLSFLQFAWSQVYSHLKQDAPARS